MFKAFLSKLALVTALLSAGSSAAWAVAYTIDLTNTSATQTINGAVYNYSNFDSGSGSYTALFRIQNNGTEAGYNYTGNSGPAPGGQVFQTSSGVGTYQVNLGDLPVVNIAGTDYVQLHWDANEGGNLFFTDFRVYANSDPSDLNPEVLVTNEANLGNLGTLIYSMDGTNAGGANTLEITAFKSGSGNDDMTINIPVSSFLYSGYSLNDDIYIWAKMTNAGSGFEEFAYVTGGLTLEQSLVPEAHSVWGGGVMVAGLLVGAIWRHRRKRVVKAAA